MKNRILMILAAALASVSCLKSGGYESQYILVVTFDDFSESWDNSVWNGEFYGDDNVYFESSISLGDVAFNCLYSEADNDYTGFGISRATAEDEGYDGRYSVNASGSASGDVFALFHNNPDITASDSDQHVIFIMSSYGTFSPLSCMVNNTKLVADKIAEYNASHENPVEVRLTATGFRGGSETGSADILLAGPRSSADNGGTGTSDATSEGDGAQGESEETSAPRDSVVSSWTLMDLRDLGSVEYINFSISLSDSDNVIPEYFCLDNFTASVNIVIPEE